VSKHYSELDPFYQREAQKYSDPIPSREFIMQYLEKQGRPATREKIIDAFHLETEEHKEAMRRRLIAMERDGQIMCSRRGSYVLVDKLDLIKGRVLGHKEGFGFVKPEDDGADIFLTPFQMRAVFPGDIVLVRIANEDRRGRREGVIVEVLEHNTRQLVGRYVIEKGLTFVTPSHKNISQDVIIPPGEQGNAKQGQMVVVEITAQPSIRRQAIGHIIEVLGDHMAPGLEIDVAMRAYGLPYQWSTALTDEVKPLREEVTAADKKDRKDLLHLPFVTIDGVDAKDFDDAVYCEKRDQSSGWRLYVAIADVSHYVKPDTELDREALNRGNSVYFPERVIPMLPEILSNGLCSLKPQVDRLCMVCEMNISPEGKIIRSSFYPAVMHSQARLTYDEVAAALQNKKTKIPAHLLPHLQQLNNLYHILRKQREIRGALEFDSTESRIVFGPDRKIAKIVPVVRNDAHRLIEECMLLANVAAARLLQQHKLATLFRVHAGPSPEKLENLRSFIQGMGLKLGGGDDPSPEDYAKLLKRIEGRPDQHLIQTVLLRSLSQAIYTPLNDGHFGLAFETYTHFTSPIRRYPDLLVHRALKHIVSKGTNKDFHYDQAAMLRMGEHCSMTERRADDATRDAVAWLKCEYMHDKLGKVFPGIISGVAAFGVFVELKDIFIEGLVHITALKNDYYQYEPTRHRLQGKRTGAVYRLGDPIQVRVARVNVDDKEIDFDLA
jgi:ribonuclease R